MAPPSLTEMLLALNVSQTVRHSGIVMQSQKHYKVQRRKNVYLCKSQLWQQHPIAQGMQSVELRSSLGHQWSRLCLFPTLNPFLGVGGGGQKQSWNWLPLVSDTFILILRVRQSVEFLVRWVGKWTKRSLQILTFVLIVPLWFIMSVKVSSPLDEKFHPGTPVIQVA